MLTCEQSLSDDATYLSFVSWECICPGKSCDGLKFAIGPKIEEADFLELVHTIVRQFACC
jgi:hypothetical protein